jgi:hypothetical protein
VIGLRNTDAFSGFRVATWPRSPSPYGKRTKAPEFYAIASGEGSGDRVENCIDAFIDVGGAQTRTDSIGDTLNQFRFDHAILRLRSPVCGVDARPGEEHVDASKEALANKPEQ